MARPSGVALASLVALALAGCGKVPLDLPPQDGGGAGQGAAAGGVAGTGGGVAGSPAPTGVLTFGPDSTLMFHPVNIYFDRFASNCGNPNPPFLDSDPLSLGLVGPIATAGGATSIGMGFHRTVPLGRDIQVVMGDVIATTYQTDANGNMINVQWGQIGHAAAEGVDLEWSPGPDPTLVDATPVVAVTVSFSLMPAKDGDPIAVRIVMVFADGGRLDLVARPTLVSNFVGCAAG